MAIGLAGASVALLADVGVLPTTFAFGSLLIMPLLTLAAAFVGAMSTGAVLTGLLVTVVAIAAPILDATSSSIAAGNFDDATGYGIATGLAIAVSGAIAFASAARRTPAVSAS